MPQKMMRALGAGVEARHLADGGGGDAAHRLHLLRREVLHLGLQRLEALGVRLHVLDVDHALGDDDVEHGVEQGDVAARLELQHVAGVAGDALVLPARVHDDQLGAALGRVLEEGGGDGMVLGRPRADDDDAVAVLGRRERRRDRAGVRRPPSAPPRRRRGTAACSGRRCWCRSPAGSASGTDRPPRWSPWPSRSRRSPCRRRAGGCVFRPEAALSSASSQRRLAEVLVDLLAPDLHVGVLRRRRRGGSAASSADRDDGCSRSRSGP